VFVLPYAQYEGTAFFDGVLVVRGTAPFTLWMGVFCNNQEKPIQNFVRIAAVNPSACDTYQTQPPSPPVSLSAVFTGTAVMAFHNLVWSIV
jgi:hypothetical protein